MKKSINIESWFVELLPNGVYHLLFNCKERWMSYHSYNDGTFIFGEDDIDSDEEREKKIQEIPDFLPKIESGHYIQTSLQEKEQISFYFIPYYSSWIKNKEKTILLKSENFI